jgi:hypothetical protein
MDLPWEDVVVISTAPQPSPEPALLGFLRHRLNLGEGALALGMRQCQLEQAPLPVVLRRYGLLSLEQFDAVLAWQESQDELSMISCR